MVEVRSPRLFLQATVVVACVLAAASLAARQDAGPVRARVEFVLHREGRELTGRGTRLHLYGPQGEVDRRSELPAGRYDLWVEVDGVDIASALFRNLEITPGDATQRIKLELPPAGAVIGRLLLADGQTPARGWVVAVQSGALPTADAPPDRWPAACAPGALDCYAQAAAAADGSFRLTGLTSGPHALDIRRPGDRRACLTIDGVQVAAGQVIDLGTVRAAESDWQHLLDPGRRAAWKESAFWGQGRVRLEEDRAVLSMGNDMTGITWTGDLPRLNYEVTLQAMRVEGRDFFCGLTFPVGEDHCSLILGGWGGGVVGLSSLDGYDASENETSKWIDFDPQRWYRVRLRVTGERIDAWLDHRPIVGVTLRDREISTRVEVEPGKPFGISTWRTTGALRDLRLRRLVPVQRHDDG